VHVSLLPRLIDGTAPQDVTTWKELADLSPEQHADARRVIGALNDVAQYVTDGLSLRSALQQYHSLFVRAGALLEPYIVQMNAPRTDSHGDLQRPTRFGRRVLVLYEAGVDYHRRHDKHRGSELLIERRSVQDRRVIRLRLLDRFGGGVGPPTRLYGDRPAIWAGGDSLSSVIARAERTLRRH
jgi:hypothetical protein